MLARPVYGAVGMCGLRSTSRVIFAGGEDAEWRAPEAGAAAGVQEGAGAVVAEAGECGLVDADEVVEGPDLAAVGVAPWGEGFSAGW
ncbi:hypothetical protein GCM10010515_06680 [Streptomyces fructofermentans]|uniref:Uncharacterized protein n=1 Tax=Streptomyces fructofermentans TaxID=152141 RepID=A0A918K311_9ACTN|nr:hypothetical protein GCM10010515_06680 [Streptomyces fructofermentans]